MQLQEIELEFGPPVDEKENGSDEVEGADEGDLPVEPGRVVIEKNDRSLSEFHRCGPP